MNKIKRLFEIDKSTVNFFFFFYTQSNSEHLPSPLLFSIYLNDLQDFLEGLNIKGIDLISRDIENELMVYF
jgi:hypothetical protein